MCTYNWLVYGLQLDFLDFVYVHSAFDYCYPVLFVINLQSESIKTLFFTRQLEITVI